MAAGVQLLPITRLATAACFAVTEADSPQIAGQIGTQATAELITAHQLVE